jgi:hypothetical protein
MTSTPTSSSAWTRSTERGRVACDSDHKPAFTKPEITLRKHGCDERSYTMRRTERPDLGAIITAYYLYLPILWVTQYKGHRTYELECMQTAAD